MTIQLIIIKSKVFEYDDDKSARVLRSRGISFEDVVEEIKKGNVLDEIAHPNKNKYPHQRMFVLRMNNYIHVVPFVINKETNKHFLKTVYPDSELNKKYENKQRGREKI